MKFLERLRQESSFDEFYSGVVEASKELTSSPTLPRYRKPPTKPGDVSAASHEFATPQSYFRRQYYEALDLVTNELKRRFQQKRRLLVAAVIEKTMLAAAGGSLEQVPDDFQIYKNDLDLARLQIQLQMLPDLIRTRNMKLSNDIPIRKVTNVRTLCEVMNEVPMSKGMFSEVLRLIKIFYTIPVTTATAERTISALRRLKTYLRATMSQQRLNHTMLLYVHKDRTDKIDIVNIARSFIKENDRRRNYFGNV